MLIHPQFDPYIFQIGIIKPTWYGLSYVAGFFAAYFLGIYRGKKTTFWNDDNMSSFINYAIIGVIIGGRLGYVFFYGMQFWAQDIWYPLRIYEGGMSFHGGMLGVFLATILFSKNKKIKILDTLDFIVPLVPLGLFFGRIGNFINGELWGRVTDLPWGMVFANGGDLPRHPSQIYEACCEGLILFIILWIYSRRPRQRGAITGLFLLGYGIFRSLLELLREPDAHLKDVAFGLLTMGQLLSIPMIIIGIYLIYRRPQQ